MGSVTFFAGRSVGIPFFLQLTVDAGGILRTDFGMTATAIHWRTDAFARSSFLITDFGVTLGTPQIGMG